VQINTSDTGNTVSISYYPPQVTDWQAANVTHAFEETLWQMIRHPNRPAAAVDILSLRDEQQIQKWRAAQEELIEDLVHERVSMQAALTPSAPAVSSWDGDLTYEQLDAKSTELAEHFRTLVPAEKAEPFVALCFEKSKWAVVFMLAVLKAGAACVSLDPAHPASRHQAILEDCNPSLILASTLHEAKMKSAAPSIPVLTIDDSTVLRTPHQPTSPLQPVVPSSAAFVIYTSGSTGTPKGVVLPHSAVCSSMAAHNRSLKIGPGARVFQFASYVFDISIGDIFTSLTNGGCVCIPSEQQRLDSVSDAITSLAANWACLTPTVASLLDPSALSGLKTLVLAGEAVNQQAIDTWTGEASPLDRFFNCYGPAECTIYSTCRDLTASASHHAANIGQPLLGRVWVVDPQDHNRLLPLGCVGELLISGPLLSRGYLNDEAKTQGAFIRRPGWASRLDLSSEERLYKTGDLVRYTPDGSLDYLGRKDSQVKLHGQRMELAEIEYHLLKHREVTQAVVGIPAAGACKSRLVAVLALTGAPETAGELEINPDQHPRCSAIQGNLTSELPAYMVPSVSIVVRSIPLNLSGKVDRVKVARWVEGLTDPGVLGEMETVSEDELETSQEKEGTIESSFREIVAYVLNVDRSRLISSRSFVGLGGDSISAMQVSSRARAQGLVVHVRDILRSKTFREVIESVRAARSQQVDQAAREDDYDTPFGLSPVQQLYIDGARNEINRFNQSMQLRFNRPVSVQEVEAAVHAVVLKHAMLRAQFSKTRDSRWSQSIPREATGSYTMRSHSITGSKGQDLASLLQHAQQAIDPTSGQAFSADLIEISNDGQLLYLVAHHLVIDVVSWRVIMEDLSNHIQDGQLAHREPHSYSFQQWLRAQREYALTLPAPTVVLPFEVPPADLAYWGMADASNRYGQVLSERFVLDARTTSTLLHDCHVSLRTEPMDVLIGALFASFKQVFSDRRMPSVVTEGHGREPWSPGMDLSTTVGWFTTMLPLAVDDTITELSEIIRQTKDRRRQVPHRGFDYFTSRYLSEEGKEAFTHHEPVEILFNYLGQFQQLERTDSLLQMERTVAVSDVADNTSRLALIEISAVVSDGLLQVNFVLSKRMRKLPYMRKWVRAYEQTLRAAVAQLAVMPPRPTLSDYPLLALTYEDLDRLQDEVLPQWNVWSFEDVEDMYPCSPMQLGLLLSHRRSTGAYEDKFTYEVTLPGPGTPDPSRLLAVWQKLIDRHAMLRTVFVESADARTLYDQLVLREGEANTVLLTCADDAVAATLAAQKPLSHEERRNRHRVTVVQTESGRVLLQLEASHAILDASSMTNLLHDLTRGYTDDLSAAPAPSYRNYVEYLTSKPVEDSIEFWKQSLGEVTPCHLPLPDPLSDTPREYAALKIDLDWAAPSLSTFCRAQGVTAGSVFQSVWGLLLQRYTGMAQVCFGNITSGRDADIAGIDEIVGPLINILISQISIDPEMRPVDLVSQVQARYAEGLSHQHVSLASVQHALGTAEQALFNTIMSIHWSPSTSAASSSPESLRFAPVASHDPTEVSHAPNFLPSRSTS
jgi:amino acid adenylation domain-containing protein/non-ribosomal peptide synthase protein (TIGR01720 family)